jgi:hypothetical protein
MSRTARLAPVGDWSSPENTPSDSVSQRASFEDACGLIQLQESFDDIGP